MSPKVHSRVHHPMMPFITGRCPGIPRLSVSGSCSTVLSHVLWTKVGAVMLSPNMSTPQGGRPAVDFNECRACLDLLGGAGRETSRLKRDT